MLLVRLLPDRLGRRLPLQKKNGKQDGQFEHWKFTGTSWKRRQQEEQQRYLENAYRVLLTRARQSMMIFVP
jgi:hypothetical protein